MSRSVAKHITLKQVVADTVGDYLMLIKMRLTSLVVFTALASYLIASGLSFTGIDLLLLAIGGFGVAGASNALNQVLEKDYDILMTRTKGRPIASGRMTMSHGVMFAGFLCMLGITALAVFNVLTAFLGMLAFVTYAFIYTPLKRYSSAAVFVGAIAGAMPMLIGVVAFTGTMTWLAIALFAIQFAWQYPHFWAIGFLGFEDYKNAGFNFVPTSEGQADHGIATSSIAYAAVLIAIGIVMGVQGLIGMIATVLMVVLGLTYLWYAIKFYKEFDIASAKKLMFSSLLYIPIVMLVLIIDKI